MFGHGQIEGFTERYGMEFKRARMDENPNEDLVARHQHEIAPLLKNRHLFADSTNFVLYDFWTGHGGVNENVFAYSNRSGDQRAVILYNNSYGSTQGTIHISAASMNKYTGSLQQRTLTEGLALPTDHSVVIAYRDVTANVEYLRRGSDLGHGGLTLGLRGYQHLVLQNWRELWSSAEQPWDSLCDDLRGAGVHNVDEALARFRFRPLHEAFKQAVSWRSIQAFATVARELAGKGAGAKGEPPSAGVAQKDKPEVKARGPEVSEGAENVSSRSAWTSEKVVLDPRLQDFVDQSEAFFHTMLERLPRERREELGSGLGEPTDASKSRDKAEKPAKPKPNFRETCERMAMAAVRLPGLALSFSSRWPASAGDILPCGEETRVPETVWGPVPCVDRGVKSSVGGRWGRVVRPVSTEDCGGREPVFVWDPGGQYLAGGIAGEGSADTNRHAAVGNDEVEDVLERWRGSLVGRGERGIWNVVPEQGTV